MDELSRLAIRERKAVEALTVLPAPAVPPLGRAGREPHLLDYLLILRKHQWLILTFALTVLTVVTIATFKMKPVYEAVASVEVDRESPNLMPFQEGSDYDAWEDSESYLETQSKILQSETLALQTIRSLELWRYPGFGGSARALAAPSPGSVATRPPILATFLSSLSVKRVPNTRLIEVRFDAEDPQLAAKIVNMHLQNYIEQNFRSKYQATEDASKRLTGELQELQVKVKQSEDARIAYEREHQIWQISEKQDITTQKLADLSKAVTDAQTDLAAKEALYRMAVAGSMDSLPDAQSSPVVQDLLRKKSDLDEQYADAVNLTGPKFPRVQRLAAEREQVEADLTKARQGLVQDAKETYDTARNRVQILQQQLNEQKSEANELAQRLVEYNILDRDAQSNKQLYDGLLEKLKEAEISTAIQSTNIRSVDTALAPTSPSRPQKGRNILLALLVGVVGGIGLAIFREYLDNTVKSPDDVEMLTGLPALTVVPSVGGLNGQAKLQHASAQAPAGRRAASPELLAYAEPKSQISEAFRALRTSLLLSQAEHPPQIILVTSALPREGKTTAAVNLAVTLAQLGDRTLLVDADLRKPGIRRALGLEGGQEAGLSSYLAGVSRLEDVTLPHPAISNLSALITGPIPPSPADLLSSHRMREAAAELRSQFKFIVIDSPPIMAATDAVILSALADGVLLVVRSGQTPKEAFTRTRDLLQGVKCRLLGVVLNAVNAHAPDYYYSYRYYAYSYGEVEAEHDALPRIPAGPGKSAGPSV